MYCLWYPRQPMQGTPTSCTPTSCMSTSCTSMACTPMQCMPMFLRALSVFFITVPLKILCLHMSGPKNCEHWTLVTGHVEGLARRTLLVVYSVTNTKPYQASTAQTHLISQLVPYTWLGVCWIFVFMCGGKRNSKCPTSDISPIIVCASFFNIAIFPV